MEKHARQLVRIAAAMLSLVLFGSLAYLIGDAKALALAVPPIAALEYSLRAW
jgi:hypothetical protein